VSRPNSLRRVLAVPMLGERGGGIGRASALLWDAMRDGWPDQVDLITLLPNGRVTPHAGDKIRFGATIAGRAWLRPPAWVLFSHLGLAGVEGVLPGRLRTPYAVFLHGIEAWRPLGPEARAAVAGATLRIANSRFTAGATLAANPGIGEIAVCPLALPKGAPVVDAPPEPNGAELRVLMVGRLAAGEGYKGHDAVLRAWPAIAARVPRARLVIVGDGDDAPRLRQLAASGGAAGSVRFTGFVERSELEAEYARAALFVLPSRGEGFGLVYLEAMAHGLACVGSIHDAASEVIDAGRTGVLADPADVESLGRTIADLLDSADRRRQMGEAGRLRVTREFLYERFSRQLVGLLQDAFPEAAKAVAG
jgi:phosphatidylinositol alpha-1,6-mannosyltransferase